MLRIIPSINAEAAKSYYTEALSREDYYAASQEIAGAWGGVAAKHLGLAGTIDKPAFYALCENRHPQTGERLTPRTKSNRRVGYDINFHCPKSVSVLYALGGDNDILNGFRASVAETMQEMEAAVKTRVRRSHANEDRQTGNMVWAEYIHTTARPVGGVPDPHLHAHCFTFNVTYDSIEERWKAGQFGAIHRDAPYYQAGFHARLAKQLVRLGYSVERTGKGWEIAGVPNSVIEKFSKRTKLIEAMAKEKGITNPKLKDQLGAKTREKKRKDIGTHVLSRLWDEQLTPQERRALAVVKQHAPHPRVSAQDAMDYSIAHSFERLSVLSDKRLMAHALQYGVGSVTVDEIKQQLVRDDLIARVVNDETICTTSRVLSEEKALLALAREGRGSCKPFVTGAYQIKRSIFSDEQRAAVRSILTTQDRIFAVRGRAGVGKTTLMQEVVEALESSGKKVFAFAPSAEASRAVLRAEGFQNAETVAALVQNQALQAKLQGHVIWVDEAGLLSTQDMTKIFQIATDHNARVLLSGDASQHHAVQRGDALRILERYAGIQFADVYQIRRQKGDYKKAIQFISNGAIERGLQILDNMGAIHELAGRDRYAALANDYLQAVQKQKSALVVSPTHAEGERVTTVIRERLREARKLGKKEQTFVQQINLASTAAARAKPGTYQPDQLVQFVQRAPGFSAGERFRVVGQTQNQVMVQDQIGNTRMLPLKFADRFQVYARREITLAKGDHLRITQNGMTKDKQHRLYNGSLYEVKGFSSAGDIELTNGWAIDKHYGNIAYGYCMTSHASQGKTVDRVFIAQSAESFPASSREQFYVSASRGKEIDFIRNKDCIL